MQRIISLKLFHNPLPVSKKQPKGPVENAPGNLCPTVSNLLFYHMEQRKIAKSSWTDLDEKALDGFATTVAITISDTEKYPDLAAEATLMTTLSNNYHKSLSLFLSKGGTTNKDAKDEDKAFLFKGLDQTSLKIEDTGAGKPDSYYTDPGFKLERNPGKHKTGAVPAPIFRKAAKTMVRGQVHFILKAVDRSEVKGVIGRYSLDNGVTWIDGLYAFKLNFKIDGMRSGADVWFQFRFDATNNRKSDWSEIKLVQIF